MAGLDDNRGHRSSRRRRHSRKSPSLLENDWAGTGASHLPDPPRWQPGGDDIEHLGEYSSMPEAPQPPPPTPPSPPPPPARCPTLSNRALVQRSSSMRTPNSAVPVLTRATTAPVRRPTYILEEEERSRSDSRRSGSRRDRSPPSAQLYRSTPDSCRSSRTSLSESDEESEATASTDDDDVNNGGGKRDRRRGKRVVTVPRAQHHHQQHHHQHQNHPRGSTRPTRAREEIIYEEDSDRETRYAPFHEQRVPRAPRAPSQHSAERLRHPRRPYREEEPRQRRGTSLEDSRSRSRSNRLSKRYYESEAVYHNRHPSSLRRSHTTGGSNGASSQSVGSSTKRSSFLGSFFGSSVQGYPPEKPVRLVECVVCMDEEVLPQRSARLKCGHRMCNSCLKRSFRLSIHDPQHMPPKCCTTDHIPLKHVEKLFDTNFKRTWNKKYAEFSTRNRIYCASRRCGNWIKPENIRRDADGRKYGECGRCKTKVCCRCGTKMHYSRECPRDEETSRFLEQAKQEGWQRCHRCKAMVELKEGCNHMTCRCGAEFCMICGSKWKTCDCPWFSDDAVENDRLEHMQIPMNIRTDPMTMRSDMFEHSPPSPRDARMMGSGGGARPASAVRPRPQSYEEEIMLRRLQEQRDDDLARRMHAFGDFDDDRHPPPHHPPPHPHHAAYEDDRGCYDNRYRESVADCPPVGHHPMGDDYRRGAAPQTASVPPSPSHAGFDRNSSGTDYVSGVNRARGVRASSMERRLADRFNTDRGSPRGAAPPPGPPPPPPPQPPAPPSSHAPSHHPPHQHSHSQPHPYPHGLPHTHPHPHPNSHSHSHSHPSVHTSSPGAVPVVPMPPPAAPVVPTLRRHTMEEELYNSARSTRPSERVVPGRIRHDYESEAMVHAPPSRQRYHHKPQHQEYYEPRNHPRQHRHRHHQQQQEESDEEQYYGRKRQQRYEDDDEEVEEPKTALAGLTGSGRGMSRVFEWRAYVEPGMPDGEEGSTMSL